MTDNQNQTPPNKQEPPGKFISIEECTASIKRWMELNDELFRRLANDESFDRLVKEVSQGYSTTLKRLADGDIAKNPQ